MKCKKKEKLYTYDKIYNNYFQSWNYNSENKSQELKELAPNKTIFFISRNQDSPNIFHGTSEIINSIAIMYLFNLKPEDIQVIFLESMELVSDPFYELYKNIISRGGKPIHIKELNQRYHKILLFIFL